jgi:hypothetical protein
MSLMGHKQTFAAQKGMSALPPEIGHFNHVDAIMA